MKGAWLRRAGLVVVCVAVGVGGGWIGGRKTAPPCCVYFSWIYDPSHAGSGMDGKDLVLFGTRGREWTGNIDLRSCQQYRKGHGYPDCVKAERNPNRDLPEPR